MLSAMTRLAPSHASMAKQARDMDMEARQPKLDQRH
jgi:hypothetical protein